MKVRKPQEQLSQFDPELDVVCYSEDETLVGEGRGFIPLDVQTANATRVERLRLDDGTPYLKFANGPASEAIATLEITSDF